MFVVEVVLGWRAESMGLVADGLDMGADAAVYLLALLAIGSSAARKLAAARFAGRVQLFLALLAFAEVGRRAVFGSAPEPAAMMALSLVALVVNVVCLGFLRHHREGEVHLQAAWIFSATDVQANLGVLAAGALVEVLGSPIPDLIIGVAITALVFRGALRIGSRVRREEMRAGPAASVDDGQRPPAMTGAVAGVLTVLVFAALHQLLISNIWFSIIPMAVAGAACGASLAWTYDLQFRPASQQTWWSFMAMHTCILLGLGGVSVLLFDPVVSMAVLIAANEPPIELIVQAMPLTVVFIIVAAAVPSLLWGRTRMKVISNVLTAAVVILLLGLNLSVLGLVDMSDGSLFALMEFLALIVVLVAGFGLTFHRFERNGIFLGDAAGVHPPAGR